MAQLTIRFDEELEQRLLGAAREQGVSLNQVVIGALRSMFGIADGARRDVVGDTLDRFIGTWTDDDEAEVLDAVRWLDDVSDPLWSERADP